MFPVTRRGAAAIVVLSAVLTALSPWCACAADIVHQILSRVGDQPLSYEAVVALIGRLSTSERVSVVSLGRSVQGRDLLCVAVHDPATVFGQGKRLMIIARQHGNEVSGTDAVMALIQHFAQAPGELERATLQRLTIIAVPVANPDGAVKRRRDNANGVDLNRDWLSLSQPETRAIHMGVQAWRPHMILDLHELPQSSPKPAYAENFVETIGAGPGVPPTVSGQTVPVAVNLASWLGVYGHRANVYYNTPGRDCRLCHRRYGLREGIPSFLVEAKTGPGRSLRSRASLHILAMLVAANHLINTGWPERALPVQVAQTPRPPAPPAPARPAAGPTEVELYAQKSPVEDGTVRVQITASVRGGAEIRFVRFLVDGRLRAITNMAPYQFELGEEDLDGAPHEVEAEVIGMDGEVLAVTRQQMAPDGGLAVAE